MFTDIVPLQCLSGVCICPWWLSLLPKPPPPGLLHTDFIQVVCMCGGWGGGAAVGGEPTCHVNFPQPPANAAVSAHMEHLVLTWPPVPLTPCPQGRSALSHLASNE